MIDCSFGATLNLYFPIRCRAAALDSPVNAGEYAVTATITDADYQGSTTGTLTIARATPTIA